MIHLQERRHPGAKGRSQGTRGLWGLPVSPPDTSTPACVHTHTHTRTQLPHALRWGPSDKQVGGAAVSLALQPSTDGAWL